MPISSSNRLSDLGTADIVVIGSGVIGLSIALEAQRRQLRVAVVDKRAGPGLGSTRTNPGIVRFHASDPATVILALEGWHCFTHWYDFVGIKPRGDPVHFCRTGSLLLGNSAGYLDKARRIMASLGVETVDHDSSSLAAQFPWMAVECFDGQAPSTTSSLSGPGVKGSHNRVPGLRGLFSPGAGLVHTPRRVTRDLALAVGKLGGRFHFGRPVERLRTRHGRVAGAVLAGGQTLWAPVVVNAAGPHSGQVVRMARAEADMKVRTLPLRHQMHRAIAPSGVDFDRAGCHVSDGDLGINFWPVDGGIVVGLEGPEAGNLACLGPDAVSSTTTTCFREATSRLARRVPGAVAPNRKSGWSGLFDVTADWAPIYDRSCVDGFYQAVGTSGNQFKAAPFVGRMMVELVMACEAGRDHDTRPTVVPGLFTGRAVDMGRYSRLRDPGTEVTNLNG